MISFDPQQLDADGDELAGHADAVDLGIGTSENLHGGLPPDDGDVLHDDHIDLPALRKLPLEEGSELGGE